MIHESKDYLKECKKTLEQYLATELQIEFNNKTQIFSISVGVDYLGYHLYLTETGKVIEKVRQQTKYKYKRKLKYMQKAYARGELKLPEIKQVLSSYHAHLSHGHTYKLEKRVLGEFVLRKDNSGGAFWDLAKFKKPTHQISFHTSRALETLKFIREKEVRDER